MGCISLVWFFNASLDQNIFEQVSHLNVSNWYKFGLEVSLLLPAWGIDVVDDPDSKWKVVIPIHPRRGQ